MENDDVEKKKGKSIFTSRYFVLPFLTLGLLGIIWFFFAFLWEHDSHSVSSSAGHEKQTINKDDSHGIKPAEKFHTPKKSHDTAKNTHDTAKPSDHSKADKKSSHKTSQHVVPPPAFGERPGVAFVEACIKPLDYELNERFWGWRPNDIINVTDNVNNLQLGVLEVTRRTAVALAENISRTGSTDAYVPSLELAMNWFMIKPTKYWFPSAESKYQEGLDELRHYIVMLKNREAGFYRRVDNLVPMLKAYESILGSCDENLVKNLGDLSFFKTDDILYYTKGVASAMGTILEAVAEDFNDTIESVQGTDVMHHAIESLHHASHIDPLIVLEGKPDGLSANHRANMAASISHARFYIGVLNIALTGNI